MQVASTVTICFNSFIGYAVFQELAIFPHAAYFLLGRVLQEVFARMGHTTATVIARESMHLVGIFEDSSMLV